MSRLLAVSVVLAFASACNTPEATDPLDLMDATYVVFAPVDEQEVPTRIRLDGDTRRALAASLPAEFRYRIQVPERALLTFTVASHHRAGRGGAATRYLQIACALGYELGEPARAPRASFCSSARST